MAQIRVLYAPRNISGQATEYAEALRSLGYDAEVWSYGQPAFAFSADRVFDKERLLTDPAYRWSVLDEAVRRFDIFHLQYGRSLLNPEGVTVPELWDLPLLKALGKRVFMHFRGSDVRLRSVHLQREAHSYFRDADLDCDEELIQGRVSICRRFCDAMFVSTPGLLDYVPDAVWIPHVVDVGAWARPPRPEREVPVVVHVPSSRATKGSAHVDRVMAGLEAERLCRYRCLSQVTRSELRAALQDADFVIDSLTIGDHGLIAVEAMAAGAIPVAHIHPTNRERNPGVPVVEADPDTLDSVMRDLVDKPARRAELRSRCAEWVRDRHDRPVVGAILDDAYRAPVRHPLLPYPEWPRSDSRRQVERLEGEIERLTSDVHPLMSGGGPTWRNVPRFLVDRLLVRIVELEDALRVAMPDAPELKPRGGRRPVQPTPSLRDRLKEHPRVHRLARRARSRLGTRWNR